QRYRAPRRSFGWSWLLLTGYRAKSRQNPDIRRGHRDLWHSGRSGLAMFGSGVRRPMASYPLKMFAGPAVPSAAPTVARPVAAAQTSASAVPDLELPDTSDAASIRQDLAAEVQVAPTVRACVEEPHRAAVPSGARHRVAPASPVVGQPFPCRHRQASAVHRSVAALREASPLAAAFHPHRAGTAPSSPHGDLRPDRHPFHLEP